MTSAPMRWVINQRQSPALLGKSVKTDELAISPQPRVLWLPRLSVPARTSAKEGALAVSPVLEMVGMMGRCGPTRGLQSVRGDQADTPSCVLVRSLLSEAATCAATAESTVNTHCAPTIPIHTNPPWGGRQDGTRLCKGLKALPDPSCWELCAKMKSQRCYLNHRLRLKGLMIKGVLKDLFLFVNVAAQQQSLRDLQISILKAVFILSHCVYAETCVFNNKIITFLHAKGCLAKSNVS